MNFFTCTFEGYVENVCVECLPQYPMPWRRARMLGTDAHFDVPIYCTHCGTHQNEKYNLAEEIIDRLATRYWLEMHRVEDPFQYAEMVREVHDILGVPGDTAP